MTTSFYNGISGIKSFQNGIDIWGNNIANINTPAFKENIPEFDTIFSTTLSTSPISSDIGLGSALSSSAINLQQGSLKHTDNPFDLAIDGKGWFKLQNGKNEFYTKNGSFIRNSDGYLIDENGNYLITANADNLKKGTNGYYIDQSINTDDLIKTGKMAPISLPENVLLPAVPTTKITLKANLDNSNTLLNPSDASGDLYFSALYNQEGENLNMRDGQSIAYTLGNIKYNQGTFSDEICINDDTLDGKDVTYDFNVNNTPIKVTLPDGSSKTDIINALANELKQKNIDYETTTNSIIIKSKNYLNITSNNNLVNNAAGATLVYKTDAKNPYEFNSLNSLKNILQTMLNIVYPNSSTLNLENGKIVIQNTTTNTTIQSRFEKTKETNNLFFKNIISAGTTILPNTAAKSASFKANIQNFSGKLYDKDGNEETLSIQFTKKEILKGKSIWEANIQIKNQDNLLTKKTQEFIFDPTGNLISPKSIKLSSPQNITLTTNITAYSKIDNYSFSYTQNGISKGFLKNYDIDENGNILAFFSNGKSSKLATIPLFHFQNPQGLENVGGDLFKQTLNSNKAFLYEKDGNYIPGSKIHSNTLETSNVNFAQAMTELIINQKAFAAAAKAVTTSDQMIQKAINMKR